MKISSETAGLISLTPVVAQEMALEKLIATIAGVTGKDAPRIREILARGTFVSGTSRLRWEPLTLDDVEFRAACNTLPDADPSLPFVPERCVEIVIRGSGTQVVITKEIGSERRLFKRTSFWTKVLEAIGHPDYREYSYAHQTDIYQGKVTKELRSSIREAVQLLRNPSRLQTMEIESVALHCCRHTLAGPDVRI